LKPLVDENLSPRLVAGLADLYPQSLHLRDCDLRGACEGKVWQYARENGFAILSKDSDFAQRSSLLGSPPEVIWLRIGNCTATRVDFILRNAAPRIRTFLSSEEDCLVFGHPRLARGD
jgi:predicted nuclease of predicted toxin-antitoxin system